MITTTLAVGLAARQRLHDTLARLEPGTVGVLGAYAADPSNGPRLRHRGAIDVSLTPAALRFIYDAATGRDLGYECLAEETFAHLTGPTNGRILLFLDLLDDQAIRLPRELAARLSRLWVDKQGEEAPPAPRERGARAQRYPMVAWVEAPGPAHRGRSLVRVSEQLTAAWRDRVLALTILTDADSPFARLHGATVQAVMISKVLAVLLTPAAAPFWDGLYAGLGSQPFYGLSLASRPIASEPRQSRYSLGKTRPSFKDLVGQSIDATRELLAGGATRATVSRSPVDPESPAMLVYIVPGLAADARLAQEYRQQIERSLPELTPTPLTPIIVEGQGAPDSDPRSRQARHKLQVALLAPIHGATDLFTAPQEIPSDTFSPDTNGHLSTGEVLGQPIPVGPVAAERTGEEEAAGATTP